MSGSAILIPCLIAMDRSASMTAAMSMAMGHWLEQYDMPPEPMVEHSGPLYQAKLHQPEYPVGG
jgi:hypothetical protein